jgi:bifunctional DNA-binding transcriptional regulator/antitoxin component of YhaV-PrlF toxin-antitoxin module
MESLRVNEYGEINIPRNITEMIGVKKGDEFRIIKKDNYYLMMPVNNNSLKEMQKICVGLDEEMGWETEEDIVKSCKEVTKELADERRKTE